MKKFPVKKSVLIVAVLVCGAVMAGLWLMRSSSAGSCARNIEAFTPGYTPTNISFYGQGKGDDNGKGFIGVNLNALGTSGLTWNGNKVYPVAVHQDHAAQHLWKVLLIKGTRVKPFYGFVVDICDRGDSECKNAYKNGLHFLIDIHKTGFQAAGNTNNGNDFTTGEFKVVGQISPKSIPNNAWLKGDKTWAMCKCTGKCDNSSQVWASVKNFNGC